MCRSRAYQRPTWLVRHPALVATITLLPHPRQHRRSSLTVMLSAAGADADLVKSISRAFAFEPLIDDEGRAVWFVARETLPLVRRLARRYFGKVWLIGDRGAYIKDLMSGTEHRQMTIFDQAEVVAVG